MFESDYKKDKKEQEEAREEIKLNTETEIAKELFGKEYNDLSIEEQVRTDRKVKRALRKKKDYKFPDRDLYSEDQEEMNINEE
jgi:hypothetical protein